MKKEDIKPMDFDNEGIWYPVRVNECFKFSKYLKGSFFKPHIDGLHLPHRHEVNIYTIIIYLNDDYKGGNTNFIEMLPKQYSILDFFKKKDLKYNILESFEPKKGSGLIFTNYQIHEGAEVIEGTKYIIKTEIVFKRVNPSSLVLKSFIKTPNYELCMALYDKTVNEMSQKKDCDGFTQTYLEAITLQYQHLLNTKEKIKTNKIEQKIMIYQVIFFIVYFLILK